VYLSLQVLLPWAPSLTLLEHRSVEVAPLSRQIFLAGLKSWSLPFEVLKYVMEWYQRLYQLVVQS
jgi:hypothetical protein